MEKLESQANDGTAFTKILSMKTVNIEPELEAEGGYTDEPLQLSLFGDDYSVPDIPAETYSTASSVTQDMIDYMLRAGSNEPHSLERIVAQFEKHKGVESNAEFLRKEFGTDGRGFRYESPDGIKTSLLSAWFDKDGITLAPGNTAHSKLSSVSMTWEQVAERIGELLAEGRYATQNVINAAEPFARKELADKLWYLHQDVEVEYFIPKHFFEGGFPTSTEKIAEALQGEKPVQEFIDGMTDLIRQYEADRDVLRFHFHKLPEMLQELKDLTIEKQEFKAAPDFSFQPKFFITEDEKDHLLTQGSGVAGGKLRISEFFSQPHTSKEKVDFLKREYGDGGCGRSGFNEWHDSKGIKYSKGSLSNCDCETSMKWNEVADRITRLVSQNKYLTQEEFNRYVERAQEVMKNPDDHFERDVKNAEAFLRKHGLLTPKPVTITCEFSESPVFENGKTYSVLEFDTIMKQADDEFIAGKNAGLEKYGSYDEWAEADESSYYQYTGYDKTSFTINLPNGETISERQDIGDGFGGVIDYMRNIPSYSNIVPILEAQRELDEAIQSRSELKTAEIENLIKFSILADEGAYARLLFPERKNENNIEEYPIENADSFVFKNHILEHDSEMGYVVRADVWKNGQSTEGAVLHSFGEDKEAVYNYLKKENAEIIGYDRHAAENDISDVEQAEGLTVQPDGEIEESSAYSEEISDIADDYDEAEFVLKVGDEIELDDGVFRITDINTTFDDTKYQLQDVNSAVPIFRVMYESELYSDGFALVKEADENNIEPPAPMESPTPNIEDIEDKVRKSFPQSIARTEQRIKALTSDLEHLKSLPVVTEGISPMTVCNMVYTEKEAAGQAILDACRKVKANEDFDLGTYKGFNMTLSFDSFTREYRLDLQREATHSITLGQSAQGSINRIHNALDSIQSRIDKSTEQLQGLNEQLETAKAELGKPFPQEKELSEKLARLAELDTLLNIDSNTPDINEQETSTKEAEVSQPENDISEELPPMSFDECVSALAEAACAADSEIFGVISNAPESNNLKNRITEMVDDMALKLKLFSRCTEVNFTSEYFGAKHDEILDKIILTAKDRLGIAAEQKRPSVLSQIAELKAAQASTQPNKPPQKNQSMDVDK